MDGSGLRVRPSQPGKVICLKCNREWSSRDRVCLRICPKCTKDQERLGWIGEHASDASGVDALLSSGGDSGYGGTGASFTAGTQRPVPGHKPPRAKQPRRRARSFRLPPPKPPVRTTPLPEPFDTTNPFDL